VNRGRFRSLLSGLTGDVARNGVGETSDLGSVRIVGHPSITRFYRAKNGYEAAEFSAVDLTCHVPRPLVQRR
jgi:hypothetical protein